MNIGSGGPSKVGRSKRVPEPHSRFAEQIVSQLGESEQIASIQRETIRNRITLLRDEAEWLEQVLGEAPQPMAAEEVPRELDDFDISAETPER